MKIGDYVRTKNGIILKIKDIEDIYTTDNIYIGMAIYDNEGHFVNDVEIIKSSPNIIDLIKVGDICKKTYPTGLVEIIPINKIEDLYSIKIDIKNGFKLSIVTKEQFEKMIYKIGD